MGNLVYYFLNFDDNQKEMKDLENPSKTLCPVIWINVRHDQVIITKRILSQLYGRGDVSGLAAAQLERKLSLCRDLLHYVARVDGGYSQFRGLSTLDYFLARRAQIERRCGHYREEQDLMEELKDVLSIVVICLKMENKVKVEFKQFHINVDLLCQNTSPGRVSQVAENIYREMFGEVDISRKDVLRLYTNTPGLDRGNVNVFLQIGLDGVDIGRVVIQLRFDLVPR